jgi:hypothetical protein
MVVVLATTCSNNLSHRSVFAMTCKLRLEEKNVRVATAVKELAKYFYFL